MKVNTAKELNIKKSRLMAGFFCFKIIHQEEYNI